MSGNVFSIKSRSTATETKCQGKHLKKTSWNATISSSKNNITKTKNVEWNSKWNSFPYTAKSHKQLLFCILYACFIFEKP